MLSLSSKQLKTIALKPLCLDFVINTYLLKVHTFEIEPQKLAFTNLDIKSRNVKKAHKWYWKKNLTP